LQRATDADAALQSVSDPYGLLDNCLAPSGSAGGKSPSVTNNSVMLTNTPAGAEPDLVFGAVNFSDAHAVCGNQVSMTGGTVRDEVYGAFHWLINGDTLVDNNSVTIGGGMLKFVAGGMARSDNAGHATAAGNSVIVSGGTFDNSIVGGEADSDCEGNAIASGNAVVIHGGTFRGSIYGGCAWSYSGSAVASNNAVKISGAPNLASAWLCGGGIQHGGSGARVSANNTLQMSCAGLTVFGLSGFQMFNFRLPAHLAAGATVLTVTNTADIGKDAVFGMSVSPGLALRTGDAFTLIEAGAGALIGNVAAAARFGTLGGYCYAIGQDGNKLVLKIGAPAAADAWQRGKGGEGWAAGVPAPGKPRIKTTPPFPLQHP
jgi:hypothetical protein